MKNRYDQALAGNLIPLLHSISRELRERSHTVRFLEGRMRHLNQRGESTSPEALDLQARLATQRRELRLARKELTRLGCEVDGLNPFRILIPGADGEFENGFTWDVGDEVVQTFTAPTAA